VTFFANSVDLQQQQFIITKT